jgi:hypothetical protein
MTNKDKKSAKTKTKTKQTPSQPKARNPTPFADTGSALGQLFGLKDLGKGIGGIVGRVLGSGDYVTNFEDVNKNSLLTSKVPGFGMEDPMVTHREYIGDVYSSSSVGAFSVQNYPINPANPVLFPWLSQIAVNYEEYTIEGMVFEFKTTSGATTSSTNTALGTVIMATEYDPTKPAFTNKQAMENYFFSQSTVPSQSAMHAVECKPGSASIRTLYTLGGSVSDVRFTNYANFQLATVGFPGASVNCGELWVSYKIRLSKPRLASAGSLAGRMSRFSAATVSGTSNIFGTTLLRQIGSLTVSWSGSLLSLQSVGPGDVFLVQIYYTGSAQTIALPTFIVTNATIVTGAWLNNSAAASNAPPAAVSSGAYATSFYVLANANMTSTVVTIASSSAGTIPNSNVDIVITQVDASAFP